MLFPIFFTFFLFFFKTKPKQPKTDTFSPTHDTLSRQAPPHPLTNKQPYILPDAKSP